MSLAPFRLARGLALAALLASGAGALAQATPEPPEADLLEALDGLVETEEGARLFTDAHAALIDWRLDAAREGFRRLGEVEPASPASAYGLNKVALWEAIVNERDPYPDRFLALNDSLGDVLREMPDGLWRRHLEGEREMHRAILFLRQERFTRAGRAFHAACGDFKATTRDADVPFVESYLGRGTCLVAAGAVPSEYKWVAALLGFRGTVADGIETLTLAFDHATVATPEAAIMLALADAALNERRAGAIDRLGEVARAHPRSVLLAYLHGTMLLETRDAPAAEAELRRAIALRATPEASAFPYADYHLGLALFRQDRFEEAATLFETYIADPPGNALVAQATLHAGLSREMLGDRRDAVRHYRRVRATRDNDSDQQAEREAERRLDHPMTETERAILLGATAYDGGRYADAIPVLQPILGDREADATLKAEAAYRTGRAYQALGDDREAIRHYRLAIARPGDPLAKWGPWAIYHIGEVHEAAGDWAAAQEAYETSLENEDEFDYHKSLEQRAKAALERVERGAQRGD
ncbi:MAG: tetratricopeptide repeat protein [Bacteroidota bacterium]